MIAIPSGIVYSVVTPIQEDTVLVLEGVNLETGVMCEWRLKWIKLNLTLTRDTISSLLWVGLHLLIRYTSCTPVRR